MKHGKTGSKIYRIWRNMRRRCNDKKNISYHRYGGRGIRVQENWATSFEDFYAYVSKLPNYDESNLGRSGITLDRIRNDNNYQEGNLKWSTPILQARNRAKNCRNKTGFTGVDIYKPSQKFRARITVNKKKIHLGYADTAKEAYQLRVDYINKNQLVGF